MQDMPLLRQYVEQGSQAAFAQLVERHLSLVYATCLREVHDPSLAEDVTQVVFLLLARKAPALREHTALAGWLFQTARFASRNALRQEARRKRVEQKVAQEMAMRSQSEAVWWESLEPHLHPALMSLSVREREAVLLRFFEGRSVKQTGVALGVDEVNRSPNFGGAGVPLTEIPREEMDRHDLTFYILNASGVNRQSTLMSVFLSAPAGFSMPLTNFRTNARFLFPPHGNPYRGAKIPVNAPLPDPKEVRAAMGGAWPDQLRTLAEKTGIAVMADYYRSKSVVVPVEDDEAASAQPSVEALDTFCRPEGYLWWNRGKTLLFRKRDWYNQRLYEVPDRWVLALCQRLRAQNGIPTYADVLSLLDLSTNQIVGLNQSAGNSSDRRLLAGLRELLAAAAVIPDDKNRPIWSGVLNSPTENNLRRASLLPDPTDPRQRARLNAFAQVFDPSFFTNPNLDAFGFLFYAGTGEQKAQAGAARVVVMLYTHEKGREGMRMGYILSLPTSLPDDRRDKTTVQVAP
jgi:RNA polymerase sigma factor (sigma-70 family)